MEYDAEGIDDIFSGILNPGNHTYVNAHCMNKEYYTGSRDILLQELQLKRSLKLSENLSVIMAGKNTVSLHIRLTDYLRNPAAICGQRYYDRAIQYMEDTLVNPYFIIFTDDPHMAKARYKFGSNVYWAVKTVIQIMKNWPSCQSVDIISSLGVHSAIGGPG